MEPLPSVSFCSAVACGVAVDTGSWVLCGSEAVRLPCVAFTTKPPSAPPSSAVMSMQAMAAGSPMPRRSFFGFCCGVPVESACV